MFGGVYYGGVGFALFLAFAPHVDTPISIPSGPPTSWVNNDVKSSSQWSTATKQAAAWVNNDIKLPSVFTAVTSTTTLWGINYQPQQTYFYNDPDMTYNSPYVEYNYLVNGNQLNQRLVTHWNGVG